MQRIAIFGDNCFDVYWIGEARALSAEAPVPVVKSSRVLTLPGMAGNVHALLSGLGSIDAQLILPLAGHDSVKNRLMTEEGIQLARWDVEDFCTPYTEEDLQRFNPASIDAIIVSDYEKGAIDALTLSYLRSWGEAGTPIFVDTKRDPWTWLGVPGVTLFPNALEFSRWRSHYEWMPSVIYKQGELGISYLRYGEDLLHLPAKATTVRNVCGAGDAVIAAFTWAAVRGYSTRDALAFANRKAAELVSLPFDKRGIPPDVCETNECTPDADTPSPIWTGYLSGEACGCVGGIQLPDPPYPHADALLDGSDCTNLDLRDSSVDTIDPRDFLRDW